MTNGQSITIGPGQTIKIRCFECSEIFAVTHEPDSIEHGTQAEVGPSEVIHCPFCGGDNIEEQ